MPESQVQASDAARKLAEENGVDLEQIEPTGANGNVTKQDVEAEIAKSAEGSADEPGGDPGNDSEESAPEAEGVAEFHVNPDLGATVVGVILHLPEGGDRTYLMGEPYSAPESLYEFFKTQTVRGLQPVKKGRI